MKILYQELPQETSAQTVAAFLCEKKIELKNVIVEYQGEVYGPEQDFALLTLTNGATLQVFRIVAGG